MDVGIGLPAARPGDDHRAVPVWARRAEAAGFSSVGVLDRLVYGNYEPLITLAAAAAVTERVRLDATILIAAYRGNTALLAKQLATLDRLSDGRLVVGVAAGGREDDFRASGTPYGDRGARLDTLIGDLRRIWHGVDGVGPRPAGEGPPIIVGGHSDPALRRAARLGDGWISGASSGTSYAERAARARAAWAAAGRTGAPRMMALAYFALGPEAELRAEKYVRDYYAFAGPYADKVLADVITDPAAVRDRIAAHAEAGCGELVFFPCGTAPDQVELLARAAGR